MGAEHLKDMLVQQREAGAVGRGASSYNEVILDAASWQRNLPRIIQGVWVSKAASEEHRAHALSVHAAFLRHYGGALAAANGKSASSFFSFPLVEYDETAEESGNAPFRDITPSGCAGGSNASVGDVRRACPCSPNNGPSVPLVLCDPWALPSG